MGVAAPLEDRLLRTVIVRIIVFRQIRVHALLLVPYVFRSQSIPVIFKMPQDEDPPHVLRTTDINTPLHRTGQDLQVRFGVHGLVVDIRMAGLGNEIPVVKAPQQGMMLYRQTVTVNTEKFPRQCVLLHTVKIVQHSLGAPAEGQNRKYMILRPADIIHQLRPVLHLFKFQTFHRGPGDDEPVVIAVFYVRELQIGFVQIGIIRVGRLPGNGAGKIYFDLQGAVTQQTQQLQLRRFLQGHQIQD